MLRSSKICFHFVVVGFHLQVEQCLVVWSFLLVANSSLFFVGFILYVSFLRKIYTLEIYWITVV